MNIFFGHDELSFSYVVSNFSNPWEAHKHRKELSKLQLTSFYWKTKTIILRSGSNVKCTFDVEIWPSSHAVCDVAFLRGKMGSKSQSVSALLCSLFCRGHISMGLWETGCTDWKLNIVVLFMFNHDYFFAASSFSKLSWSLWIYLNTIYSLKCQFQLIFWINVIIFHWSINLEV